MPELNNAAATDKSAARRRALGGIAAVFAVGAVGYAAWTLLSGTHESTDNAYVQADVVPITAQVGGTVVALGVDDTDYVRAGQPLVTLDAADARVAVQQAEAQLAQTVREVRTLYANGAGLGAQVRAREAELQRGQTELARLQDDLARRQPLLASGAVGQEEFQHTQSQLTAARNSVAAAQAALAAAREQHGSATSLIDGTDVIHHPRVEQAAAKVREAHLALARTVVPAPVDGHVARRSVQLGQRVQSGAPLMSVVGLQRVWVDANFKESQLQRLRIGQPAELVADVYGQQVVYHGKVAGLGAGTGAAFALLPAQNATGNWIKVVQRVPVRIELDAAEVAKHPLRVGLSMEVEVDVARQDGKLLADAPRTEPRAATRVYDAAERAADAAVQRIITANLGRGGVSPAAKPVAPVRKTA